jgi:hypothetical protein
LLHDKSNFASALSNDSNNMMKVDLMALELIGIEAVWNCCYQNSTEAVAEIKNEM